MTILGAITESGATRHLSREAQRRLRDTTTHLISPETQLNTAVDRPGLKQAVVFTDPWSFDPAMDTPKTSARMHPDRAFETYRLEERFGIHFDHPGHGGARVYRPEFIEHTGLITSCRRPCSGGITRVWMAVGERAK